MFLAPFDRELSPLQDIKNPKFPTDR